MIYVLICVLFKLFELFGYKEDGYIKGYGNILDSIYAILEYDKITKQRENFVTALVHDLKTPIISQITALEMILDEGCDKLNNNQRLILQSVLNSCKYIKEMVFNLLEVYKYKNGKVVLEYESFNIDKLVRECVNETEALAKEKRIRFEIRSNSINNTIYADRIQLKRVIMNLISNAIKYAYEEGDIKISLVNSKGYFRFYIENSAPMISDDILKQLFKEYSSFSKKTARKGTGLGLYLSRKIIEAHNGNIKAESSEDDKNTFSFYIPSIIIEDNDKVYNRKRDRRNMTF